MTIALLHLGRTAAGPQLTLELARALIVEAEPVIVVYSAEAEIAAELAALPCPTLAVHTFSSTVGALVGIVRLPWIGYCIDGFLAEHQATTVIITMEQIWQGLLGGRIGRNRCVMLMVHDGAPHVGENGFVVRWLRGLERRNADAAIVLSEHVEHSLIEQGTFEASRIHRTVHPAFELPTSVEPRALPRDRPVILGFFGRMSRYKGLALGVAAVAEVLDRGRAVRFHIAGKGIPRDVPSILRPEIELEDRWIPQDEVVDVVRAYDIMLLPYTEASQSGVLAYAMALGIPTIVTPVGGLVEQATEAGCAIVADDTTALAVADSIETLLDSAETYARLSTAGLDAAATRFSWRRTAPRSSFSSA